MSWQQNAVQRVQDKSASDPPDDTSTDSSILRYIKTLSKHQTNAKQQRMDQYLQQVKHAENFSTRVFNPPRHMTTTEGQGQQVQKKLSASTVKSKGNDRVRNDRKQATRFTKTSRSRSKRPHETNLENRQLKKPKRAQQTTAIEWLEQFRLHGTWSQKSATRPNEDYSSDKTHQDTTVPAGSKHVQPIERLQSPTVPQTASRINADTERRPIQELKPLSKKTRTAPVEDGEHVFAQASNFGNEYPSSASLCGEDLAKETGMINGLYYVFYESSANKVDVPVILWLTGGPGCSGLVALLFENGPCSFDDEEDTVSLNPFSWTGLAHIIYLDQPRGTGYSDGDNGIRHPWSLGGAADKMHGFLQQFYLQHQDLKANDFYLFGESYAGHYVPDLAVRLLDEDGSLPILKGIAIGNGVVSTTAWVESAIPFLKSNDLLGSSEKMLEKYRDQFRSAMARCSRANSLQHLPPQGLDSNCSEALQRLLDFEVQTSSLVWNLGRNMYDIRRECHLDDVLGLCYRFSRLETFVNAPAIRAYFHETYHKWNLCSSGALPELITMDKLEESELNVARILEHGVRVLVYGGDADTVVNWLSQDSWTRDLDWKHQTAFNLASFEEIVLDGQSVGRIRTSHGLSFMKVFHAGHMVPHDQPAITYEIVRSFLYDTPGVGMFKNTVELLVAVERRAQRAEDVTARIALAAAAIAHNFFTMHAALQSAELQLTFGGLPGTLAQGALGQCRLVFAGKQLTDATVLPNARFQRQTLLQDDYVPTGKERSRQRLNDVCGGFQGDIEVQVDGGGGVKITSQSSIAMLSSRERFMVN